MRERSRVIVKVRPTQETEQEALGAAIVVPAPGRVLVKCAGPPRAAHTPLRGTPGTPRTPRTPRAGEAREFDRVLLPSEPDADERLYVDEVRPLVDSLYSGINSTVLAHGASGAGKTHTVLGSGSQPGLLDRITADLFSARAYDQRCCNISVSVEELYMECFTDLLAPQDSAPEWSSHGTSSKASPGKGAATLGAQLRLLGRRAKGAPAAPVLAEKQAPGGRYSCRTVAVSSACEMQQLVQAALLKRHTAATLLNERSSRSHVVITINLEQRRRLGVVDDDDEAASPSSRQRAGGCQAAGSTSGSSNGSAAGSTSGGSSDADATCVLSTGSSDDVVTRRRLSRDTCGSSGGADAVTTYLAGKLYLVDLAGSESIKRSGADGKEAGTINRSLCHLKTVIEEVFRGRRVSTYRNSKLTFKLADALGGGNSRLLVIACITTAAASLQDTRETLRFAEMARSITNTPLVNRSSKDTLIARLQSQLAEAQEQLTSSAAPKGEDDAPDAALLLAQLNRVEAALAGSQAELEAKKAHWTQQQEELAQLQQQLAASHQELQAQEASQRQLLQQLQLEQASRQSAQDVAAEALAQLQAAAVDAPDLLAQCLALQQQLSAQHAVAAATAAAAACGQQVLSAQEQATARAAVQQQQQLCALQQQLQQAQALQAQLAQQEQLASGLAAQQQAAMLQLPQLLKKKVGGLCLQVQDCMPAPSGSRAVTPASSFRSDASPEPGAAAPQALAGLMVLLQCGQPDAAARAASSLRRLCQAGAAAQQQVAELPGCIDVLVQLLHCGQPKPAAAAAAALGRLAADDAELQQRVAGAPGCLRGLVGLLQNSAGADADAAASAADALRRLVFGNAVTQARVAEEPGAVAALAQLLRCGGHAKCAAAAAACLDRLVADNEALQARVACEDGLAAALVALLHGSAAAAWTAATALRRLFQRNPPVQRRLADVPGLVDGLVGLLGSSGQPEAAAAAAAALGRLCAGVPELQQQLAGRAGALVPLLRADQAEAAATAADTAKVIAQGCRPAQQLAAAAPGLVAALAALLDVAVQPRAAAAAAAALTCLCEGNAQAQRLLAAAGAPARLAALAAVPGTSNAAKWASHHARQLLALPMLE